MADRTLKSITFPGLPNRYVVPPISNTAQEYSASSTYEVGDIVSYNRKIYRCTTAIINPEGFSPSHWIETTLGDEVKRLDDGKVDKVTGKQLSTEDYTTAEKTKLAGIEAQANKTVIDDTLTESGQAADAKAAGDALDELREDIGSVAITKTASGEIVSFSDGADGLPIKDLLCSIEPVQDLHGQDAPYPAGGGKNKFDRSLMSDAESGTKYIELTLKPNTAYTASSNDPMTSGAANIFFLLPGESVNTGINGVYLNRPVTKTTGADGIARIGYRVYNNLPVATLVGFETQVEEGSSSTAYSPYSNLCPISGWTGLSLTRDGANILDPVAVFGDAPTQYTVNQDGSITVKASDGRAWSLVNPIPIKKGTYTLSRTTANGWVDIRLSTENYSVSHQMNTTMLSVTFTIVEDGYYKVKFGYSASSYPFASEVQLEPGTTASPYKPYQGETTPVSWQTEAGTVYKGGVNLTTGELTATVGYIIKNTAEMDNSEDYPGWKNSGVREIVGGGFNAFLTDAFTNISPKSTYAVGANTNGTNDMLLLSKAYFNKTQSEWIALAMDVQLVIPLAQPITVQLDPVTISTLLGENNIWCDTGSILNCEYPADTKMYIDDLEQAFEEFKADGGITVVSVTGANPVIVAEPNHRYVCGTVDTISFTPCPTGLCDVVFTSGTTPAVLTLPGTVRLPDWFNTGTMDASTTYEINVMDGTLGAASAWV